MPRATLDDLVYRRSFLARRHAHLLVEDSLVGDRRLRQLQKRYRVEPSALERRALALTFERALRDARALDELDVDPDDDDEDGPTLEERLAELDAIVNAPPVEVDMDAEWKATERFSRAVRMRDLQRGGLNAKEIGAHFDVSARTVQRELRRLERELGVFA